MTASRPLWTVADMPRDAYRFSQDATIVDSRYIFVSKRDTAMVYDSTTDTWSEHPTLTTGRRSARVSMLGSQLLVTGGPDRNGGTLSSAVSLDASYLVDIVYDAIRARIENQFLRQS